MYISIYYISSIVATSIIFSFRFFFFHAPRRTPPFAYVFIFTHKRWWRWSDFDFVVLEFSFSACAQTPSLSTMITSSRGNVLRLDTVAPLENITYRFGFILSNSNFDCHCWILEIDCELPCGNQYAVCLIRMMIGNWNLFAFPIFSSRSINVWSCSIFEIR